MKRRILVLTGLCSVMVSAAMVVSSQAQVGNNKVGDNISFNSISKAEIEMLVADIAKTNPTTIKRLSENPELKKAQIESLRQLLAFASQAQKDGLASDPTNKQEMENIRAEVLATNYDKEINKDNGPMPPFGFITDDQVRAYWGDKTHEAEFSGFLNAKIAVMSASNPEMKGREITGDEREQARDIFAKTRIYLAEYDQKVKSGALSRAFIDKANLQVKLQQAQFLARLYSDKVADQIKVTDEDIAGYIALHPEIDPARKRGRAQGILDRAKAGENFAALANRFSEDPGKKGLKGKLQGGIYVEVPTGKMVPEFENAVFENAVLALEPGQIAPSLVETDFGYHIIKLERKRVGKDTSGEPTQIYDVRHILISTSYKDPTDASARDMPVRNYVRNKLAEGKEKLLVERLVVENKISVPDNFTVPVVTEEQMEQFRQKQLMQISQGVSGTDDKAAKPVVKRPKVVKKPLVRRKRPVKKPR